MRNQRTPRESVRLCQSLEPNDNVHHRRKFDNRQQSMYQNIAPMTTTIEPQVIPHQHMHHTLISFHLVTKVAYVHRLASRAKTCVPPFTLLEQAQSRAQA